eukprot:2709352-Pyramimonas_sp.AAC.1
MTYERSGWPSAGGLERISEASWAGSTNLFAKCETRSTHQQPEGGLAARELRTAANCVGPGGHIIGIFL